ncbi:DUF6208 family protein [Pleurocapsa sp. PCC 7319]|uniref:DUF6208 family protein n=1 Tax=Pleurocapsa sp. PCC 7319 TaxID=118161 RepID=UPI00034D2518|nr:DUF6208 family protein [Pleurocapsa sp. PCC 7319]
MIRFNRIFANAELLWEIPLALFSFVFFKLMKFAIRNLYNFRLSRSDQQNLKWLPLSKDILKTPITLPFWMTFGPRLNTHAIIATVGPFKVNKSLDLLVEAAEKSAKSWTIVVYKFPDYQTVIRLGYGDSKYDNQWESIELPSGKYLLGLRYYNWQEQVKLPAVKVDGVEIVHSKTIPEDINNFYYELRKQENWFYFCLHYYLFPMFRLRKWLPESLIKKEFLPVGDPALVYYYGLLEKQESLKLTLNPIIFQNYEVYITMYDRASFASSFYQIKETNHVTNPLETAGFYLLRIRQKPAIQEQFVSEWVEIKVLMANSEAIAVNSYS